jgi:REP element-mobilizing transposase RayT
MSEDSCLLKCDERKLVELQIVETCEHNGWVLHASNFRTNHMHFVTSSNDVAPKKIRKDVKAWCTQRLRESSDPKRQKWWAERGSIRWIFDEAGLETVVEYVTEAQQRKSRMH